MLSAGTFTSDTSEPYLLPREAVDAASSIRYRYVSTAAAVAAASDGPQATTRASNPFLAPSRSFPLRISRSLIIPRAVVSFDYETRSGRTLARASICLPADPMCCTTPNGIAPSRSGRIARYNGPLHNGIRTCDIPAVTRRRRSPPSSPVPGTIRAPPS